MTSELINSLKSRKGKSAIINLSSFAGENAQPYITLYSSTKAMNTFFSEALSLEHPEIDILSVRPMFVESPLSRQKKGFNIPDRR
jgi:17beta-estradiol 17-dehydrogenase / very-long-chain 3-oxoacyl-CoA reductase